MGEAFFGQESCGGRVDRAGPLMVTNKEWGLKLPEIPLAWGIWTAAVSLRGAREPGGPGWKDRGLRHYGLVWQDHARSYIIFQVLLNAHLNCGPTHAGGWECDINQN